MLEIFESAKKLNIYATLIAILIGLFGHFLIIIVLGQKRFRTNSSNIYLLCLAINDSLFLIVHLFEDTIRTYIDVYIDETNAHKLLNRFIFSLDITDKYDITCRLMNYFRFVLRFTSSYILVVYSLQRLYIVYSPFSDKFKSKNSAWFTCFVILIISAVINMWALVLFELQRDEDVVYCDVSKPSTRDYFHIPAIFISVDMLLPIAIILTCNLIIIYKLKMASFKRKKLNIIKQTLHDINKKQTQESKLNPRPKFVLSREMSTLSKLNSFSYISSLSKNASLAHNLFPFADLNSQISAHNSEISSNYKLKPYYTSVNQTANRPQTSNGNDSRKTTINLLLISFIFVILNFPFLVTWFLLYYQVAFVGSNLEAKDSLLAASQICEIFHILNYSILFYVYCALGSKFRNQLKNFGEYY